MSRGNTTLEGKANRKNGIKRLVFSALGVLLQALWMVLLIRQIGGYAQWISFAINVLALIFALAIYSQDKTNSLKVPWIILIITFPLLGVILYLLIGNARSTKKMRLRYKEADDKILPMLKQNKQNEQALYAYDEGIAGISHYIGNYGKYPLYRNTDIDFYSNALLGLEAQKEELKKAEEFIFMEYHAIADDESWQGIQDILELKVKDGVEVRIFYDDIGSIGFINKDFVRKMEDIGIHCRVFNPVSPVFRLFLNNRDHRKITVIDGKVGFTGGYNLANEYFGITEPYGKWKDTGIRLEGDAVKSLTAIFLEMWNAADGTFEDRAVQKYLSDYRYMAKEQGFVQPYGDNPILDEHLAENVYISLIENSKRYCYFTTPYLVITDEMNHALGLAAKRGVDIRIITPGIPDKKLIYSLSRSYYPRLLKNGVRIYEYTPGFCHAKQCVSDDRVALCGTINLDYRSLYHHFENGCMIADCKAVGEIKKDFESMFLESKEVTEELMSKKYSFTRFGQLILRLFAALL